jgi:hypothetical protein
MRPHVLQKSQWLIETCPGHGGGWWKDRTHSTDWASESDEAVPSGKPLLVLVTHKSKPNFENQKLKCRD